MHHSVRETESAFAFTSKKPCLMCERPFWGMFYLLYEFTRTRGVTQNSILFVRFPALSSITPLSLELPRGHDIARSGTLALSR